MKLAYAKAAALLLGGILLSGTGAWYVLEGVELMRHGQQSAGEVIDVRVQRVRGSRLYHPVVRFLTADQSPVEFKEKTGLWNGQFEVGQSVTVRYFEADPSNAKIESFWTLWFLPLMLIVFGTVSLAAGWHTLPR